jgi:DNA processing protein
LDKLKLVPVHVRSTGELSAGLDALQKKGALPWPNPQDVDEFECVFDVVMPTTLASPQSGLSLFSGKESSDVAPTSPTVPEPPQAIKAPTKPEPAPTSLPINEPVELTAEPSPSVVPTLDAEPEKASTEVEMASTPADTLFAAVREVTRLLLKTPMKDAEVAAALDISNAQAKAWLQRLVDEGVLEKQKKPAGYIVKQKRLFE